MDGHQPKKRVLSTPIKKTPQKPCLYQAPRKHEGRSVGKDLGVSSDYADSKQYVKRQAAKYIGDGRMLQGLSFLAKNHSPAKKTMENMAQDIIAKELRVIASDKTSPFRMKVNRKNIESFDWGDAVDATQKVAPTIVATLMTLLPFVSGGKRKGWKAAKR